VLGVECWGGGERTRIPFNASISPLFLSVFSASSVNSVLEFPHFLTSRKLVKQWVTRRTRTCNDCSETGALPLSKCVCFARRGAKSFPDILRLRTSRKSRFFTVCCSNRTELRAGLGRDGI
jgi:hypothetical protein